MKKYAIIVAGGKGVRMESEIPKQFLLLDGTPILMHCIKTFYLYDPTIEIIVALPEEQIDYWKDLTHQYDLNIEHKIVAGGVTRFHSVKNALRLVEENSMVAIHDGVRPLVTVDLIARAYDALKQYRGAYPAIEVSDTLRKWAPSAKAYKLVDRNQYCLVQTPQTFLSTYLLRAYDTEYSEEYTDDIEVFSRIRNNFPIKTIEGDSENIKITRPEDLRIASAILKCRN